VVVDFGRCPGGTGGRHPHFIKDGECASKLVKKYSIPHNMHPNKHDLEFHL
jgi:hypothetical protein